MARKRSNGGADPPPKPERKEAKHGRLAIFPAAAINDSRVSPSMLAILAALSTYTSRSGYVEASHASIAVRLGVSRQYVQRILATLEALGYLKSVRRKRASDQGETSKAYRLELDYRLPVAYWRYVPTDYGEEPEENALDALFSIAPPAISQVAPRTYVINDLVGVVNNAHAREMLTPQLSALAADIAHAARLPASANLEALASALERFRADGLTDSDMLIAAGDCAEWYATKRNTAPRLGNLTDWLRRELTQRRRLEAEAQQAQQAQEEVHAHDHDTANAGGSSAGASELERGRARHHSSRSGGARPQAARARHAQERAAHASTDGGGGSAAGASADWRPGTRAYLEPEEPGGAWTIITESGERIPWRPEDDSGSAAGGKRSG